MKKTSVLLMLLLTMIFLCFSISAAETNCSYMLSSESNRIIIYESPNDNSSQIGWYYSGTLVNAEETDNTEWMFIHAGVNGEANGYVKKNYLVASELKAYDSLPVFSSTTDTWKLYSSPAITSKFNNFGNEQNIYLLGVYRDWWHIQFDNYSGFVQVGATHLSLKKGAYYDGYTYCVVKNPKSEDRLNLREKPNEGSRSLGKYYNGVKAVILSGETKKWVHVRIGELEGYMLSKYLSFDTNVPSAMPILSIRNKAGTGLNLRTKQSTSSKSLGMFLNGESVTVLGLNDKWCHVDIDGKTGFMLLSGFKGQISYSLSSGNKASSKTRKATINQNCSLLNTCNNPTEYNIMTALDPGDSVTVLSIDGTWAKVMIESGKTGYVHTTVLDMKSTSNSSTHKEKTATINQHCSLYSTSNNPTEDNIMTTLCPNDRVTVLSINGDWTKIKIETGKIGYVVTSVLNID